MSHSLLEVGVRPRFHFTPPKNWMNDPNGLVYYQGEYHLFYQYHPNSNVWGPMHWGHAVSKDLVTWEHLPIALSPDEQGYIFSGSAVADVDNRSGLGTADNPPLISIFTYHDPIAEESSEDGFQSQAIAFSQDNGRVWQKYKHNPVLRNRDLKDFRDPKVTWYEKGNQWIMSIAAGDHIRFYATTNLLDWDFLSDFGTYSNQWRSDGEDFLQIRNSYFFV